MGLLSALSGKTYHFNSINTPIDNELAYRIKELDDNIEKLALAFSFDTAQSTILNIFHPDSGIFKDHITALSKDNLRNIWNIIIAHSIYFILENNKNIDKKKLIKNTMLTLGLDNKKIEMLFMFFKDKNELESLIMLWSNICNQISPNIDIKDSIYEFQNIFVDIFNNNYSKVANA